MTTATSSYLNLPLRTEEAVRNGQAYRAIDCLITAGKANTLTIGEARAMLYNFGWTAEAIAALQIKGVNQ